MIKKTRPDRLPFWEKISPEQSEAIHRMLIVERLTYAAAVEQIQKRLGLSVNSRQVFKFFQRVCGPRIIAEQSASNAVKVAPQKITIEITIGSETRISISAPEGRVDLK